MLVEDKRFAVAVHYRLVDARDLPRVEAAVDRAAADSADPGDGGGRLRKTGGKKVWELRPDVDWDKGRALLWLLGLIVLPHVELAVLSLSTRVAPRSTPLPAVQVRSLTRDPGLRASIPQQVASYRPPSRKG